jgi:hypothetical protein
MKMENDFKFPDDAFLPIKDREAYIKKEREKSAKIPFRPYFIMNGIRYYAPGYPKDLTQ